MASSFRKKEKMEFLLYPSCVSERAIVNEFFNYQQLTNLIIMGLFQNKEQKNKEEQLPPDQLMVYPVSCSPMSLPDNWERYESGNFKPVPKDIILVIANYLSRSHRGVLERVSKYFLSIIRSKWPPKPEYLFLYDLNTKIEYLLELNLREFCMKLHNVEITYNNVTSNSKMGPTRYFLGRTSHRPPPDSIMNSSQWEGLMLKFEKDDTPLYRTLWRDHIKGYKNLVYLTLTDADDIHLEIQHHEKLEGFFAKLNSADGLGGRIFLPPNMKQIVLYASEENYQEHHTQFLEGYVGRLDLYAQTCTNLEFW
jgi:hypothetical protein